MLAHLKRAPFLSSTLFHLPPTHFPQGAFSLFRSLVAKKNLRASYITVMTAEIGSIHIHSVSVTIKFIHIINKFSALVLSLSSIRSCGERGKSRKEFSLPYRKKEFGMKKWSLPSQHIYLAAGGGLETRWSIRFCTLNNYTGKSCHVEKSAAAALPG